MALDSSWPRVAPVEFHLKLVAAAGTGLADPVALIDAQRRELMRRLRDVQRLAESQIAGDDGDGVLLLGSALRLQADIRWLEACEKRWTGGRDGAVVQAEGLRRHFRGDGEPVRAVDGVDLVVEQGEAVSIMGPSGCGKSTCCTCWVGWNDPTPAP